MSTTPDDFPRLTDEELARELFPEAPKYALAKVAQLTPEKREACERLIDLARRLERGDDLPADVIVCGRRR